VEHRCENVEHHVRGKGPKPKPLTSKPGPGLVVACSQCIASSLCPILPRTHAGGSVRDVYSTVRQVCIKEHLRGHPILGGARVRGIPS
jgi:hypothetical protein